MDRPIELPSFEADTERNGTFLTMTLVIEGTTEKVVQFIMPQMSINHKNVCLKKQKCTLKIVHRVKTIKSV